MKLGHDSFLPHSFQFINQSSIYLSTICIISYYSVERSPTIVVHTTYLKRGELILRTFNVRLHSVWRSKREINFRENYNKVFLSCCRIV